MATEVIPTSNTLSVYRFRLNLGSTEFGLSFRWNRRSGHWDVDLTTPQGTQLRSGLRIVANWPLLRTMVQQGRPSGELIAVNRHQSDDPDRDTIGQLIPFCYSEVDS